MKLNDYQDAALTTAIYPDDQEIVYPALGLCGEAGEVAEKVKKVLRDDLGNFTDEKKRIIAKELCDLLWYIAALSADLGYTLEEIADMNLKKLGDRALRGVLSGSGDDR